MFVIFVLTSVTYAMKGQELLKKHSIDARLTRQAAIKAIKGCGYGLKVDAAAEGTAQRILDGAEIKILGKVMVRE